MFQAFALRILCALFFVGVIAVGVLPAHAANIRATIGKPLQEALSLAASGDYQAAMEKVNEADAVANKTPDEVSTIGQVKSYIGAKSGDISLSGAAAAKNKLASDYSAKSYAAVIADGDALKKAGALDSTSATVVAQAYYLSGDKTGCVTYIKSNFGNSASGATLLLLLKCAYDAGDKDTQRAAQAAIDIAKPNGAGASSDKAPEAQAGDVNQGANDANAGLDALNRGDFDSAIRLFTQALNSGSLLPDDREYAYVERGKAYLQENRSALARADADQALQINSTDPDAVALRSQTK